MAFPMGRDKTTVTKDVNDALLLMCPDSNITCISLPATNPSKRKHGDKDWRYCTRNK